MNMHDAKFTLWTPKLWILAKTLPYTTTVFVQRLSLCNDEFYDSLKVAHLFMSIFYSEYPRPLRPRIDGSSLFRRLIKKFKCRDLFGILGI